MQSFWKSLNSVEANCLESLLNAASLFQLQLQQNEQRLLETKEALVARQAICDRLQRNAQRVTQRLERADHASAATRRELRRLEKAAVSNAAIDGDCDAFALQRRRGELQAEEVTAASELLEHQAQVQDLRERLAAAKHRCQQRRGDLEMLRQRCWQEKLDLKQIREQDLDAIRQDTELAMQKIVELKDAERESLVAEYSEEVQALRSAELLAKQRQSEVQMQRDEAAEELAARLQEGNVLRDFCSQTHQEVAQLSAQLRGANDRVEELEESSDSEVELEVQELQQRCHALERQCAHAQAAASRMPFAKLSTSDLSFAESSEPLILEGGNAKTDPD